MAYAWDYGQCARYRLYLMMNGKTKIKYKLLAKIDTFKHFRLWNIAKVVVENMLKPLQRCCQENLEAGPSRKCKFGRAMSSPFGWLGQWLGTVSAGRHGSS